MTLCSKQAQKHMRQKQLEIEEFSVYWDTSSTMLGDLPAAEIQVCICTHKKLICSIDLVVNGLDIYPEHTQD